MRNAFIALHVSILLAGWTGVFGKLIELTPFIIVFWRVVIGGSVLLGIVLAVKRLEKCSAKNISEFPAGSPGLEPREECQLSKFF